MNTRRSKLFLILIGLLLLAVATACSTRSKPEISLVADSLLASEAEQLLWQKSELEQRIFDSNDLIYADPQLESYLNHVVARLMPETVPADLVLRVNVIKSPYLNAFAYPNGMIYIHSGLLARMDNDRKKTRLERICKVFFLTCFIILRNRYPLVRGIHIYPVRFVVLVVECGEVVHWSAWHI